jgi:hypothetical protein
MWGNDHFHVRVSSKGEMQHLNSQNCIAKRRLSRSREVDFGSNEALLANRFSAAAVVNVEHQSSTRQRTLSGGTVYELAAL